MKKHLLASALVIFIGALLTSACDSDDSGYVYAGGGGSLERYCAHFVTCGTCTPVDGCGWCQTGVNQGMCAADPNECAGATAFSWTWDPSGCFPETDASAPDASEGPPAIDAASSGPLPIPDDGGASDADPLAH
jgi:hypothetical protein